MNEIKTRSKLTSWPSPQDYNEAIQDLHTNCEDPQLRKGAVEVNALGIPRPLSGSFASVYRVHAGGNDLAVRCFLRDIRDQEQRYALISDFVQHDTLPYTVTFDFVRQGIRINGRWHPLLKMDWLNGLNLDLYVEKNLHVEGAIAKLADSFKQMCDELQAAGIAHGDLQHGNIIVCDDELRLVDYDGMYVPGMKGMHSNEIGHRNYQHPRRNATNFGEYLDNFSAWVIYTSLKALSIDPSLFQRLGACDDCLLFRRDDFIEPEHSYTFGLLEQHENPEIVALTKFIRWQLKQPIATVPPLSSQIPETPALPPIAFESAGVKTRQEFVDNATAQTMPSQQSGALPDWLDPAAVTPSMVRAARQPNVPPSRTQVKATASQSTWNRTQLNAQTIKNAAHQTLIQGIEPELQQPIPRAIKFEDAARIEPHLAQGLMLLNPLFWFMLMPLAVHDSAAVSVAWVCFFINLLFEFGIWYTPSKHKRLATFGQAAKTSQIKTWTKTDAENGVRYFYSFEFFSASNRHYLVERSTSKSNFERIARLQTKPQTVLYDTIDPNNAELYALSCYKAISVPPMPTTVEPELQTYTTRPVKFNANSYMHPFALICLTLFSPTSWLPFVLPSSTPYMVPITLFILWLIWAISRPDYLLARNGIPATATLVEVLPFDTNSTTPTPVAVLEFNGPNGRPMKIRKRVTLEQSRTLLKGRKLTVLYDPSDPENNNVIYKFSRFLAV